MIAVGIGLHNLGEGLAIGSAYAVGELALGAALVVGFALHNTTEGAGGRRPAGRRSARRCSACSALGPGRRRPGDPRRRDRARSVDNAELSALLLGVGVGAIVQVVVVLVPSVRTSPGAPVSPAALAGIAGGVLLMYATGLLVTA